MKFDIAYDILPNDIARVEENEDLILYDVPSLTCDYFSMNMNKEPFNIPEVREAINLAIDRQLIIDTIVSGAGQPADAIIAPDVFGDVSLALMSMIRRRQESCWRKQDMKMDLRQVSG